MWHVGAPSEATAILASRHLESGRRSAGLALALASEPMTTPRSRTVLVVWTLAALLVAPRVGAQADKPAPVEPRREAFPSLAHALELARARSPEVVSKNAAVDVARAGYQGARLSPLDNPYLEVFSDRGLESNATRDVTIAANLWLPIELGNQRGRRIAEVDALVKWQGAAAGAARARASGDAVRAYGAAVVAGARVRAYEEIVAVAKAEASLYEARLGAGDATLHDERLAKLELARTSVLLAESRADLARALGALGALAQRSFEPPPATASFEPPSPKKTDPAQVAKRAPEVESSTAEAAFFAKASERARAEAYPALNLIVSAGRGDLGEPRVGGGVAWTFPVLRRNQTEVARAQAESRRAGLETRAKEGAIGVVLGALESEREHVREATLRVDRDARPAAVASLDAATETQSAGKGEVLRVLTARRDLILVRMRKLDLAAREWELLAAHVTLSGALP